MISPIRHILQVSEKYEIHAICAHIKKLLSNSDFRCQWKWFTLPKMVTITYLEGATKPPTFFFKTQNSSNVQICNNSRTNYKMAQKSYAVIISVIWFWKIKTFENAVRASHEVLHSTIDEVCHIEMVFRNPKIII